MDTELVTQCPDLCASTRFDPAHFYNWWQSNAAGIRYRGDALVAYRADRAGHAFKETLTVAEGLYTHWLEHVDSEAVTFSGPREEYSADTQRLLKVLHVKVFSHNPVASPEPARILVAGDVQSGKTGAYTELIRALLAARGTVGFPDRYIFLVLGGVHNKLRRQTQERLSSELATHEETGDLVWLTSKEGDLVAAIVRGRSKEGNLSAESSR